MRSVPCPDPELGTERGVAVAGYTTADGQHHPYDGRVRLEEDGRLAFVPRTTDRPRPTESALGGETGRRFAVGREELLAVELETPRGPEVPFFGGFLTGLGLGYLAALIAVGIAFSGFRGD